MSTFLFVFVISLFTGEPGVLALSFAAEREIFPILVVAVAAFISAIVAESFWFLAANSLVPKKIIGFFQHKSEAHEKIKNRLTQMSQRTIFGTLLVSRFFSGFTILMLLYFGKRKTEHHLTYGKFLLMICIVNLIWTPIIVTLGWFAGQGFTWAQTLFQNLQLSLGILAGIILLFYLLKLSVQKYFAK